MSQERFQPMMSPTRDFILEMILRQPYIEMLSSPQNIFVPLFEILATLLGEIYQHHEKPYQTHVNYLNTSINIPESVLYTRPSVSSFLQSNDSIVYIHFHNVGEIMSACLIF